MERLVSQQVSRDPGFLWVHERFCSAHPRTRREPRDPHGGPPLESCMRRCRTNSVHQSTGPWSETLEGCCHPPKTWKGRVGHAQDRFSPAYQGAVPLGCKRRGSPLLEGASWLHCEHPAERVDPKSSPERWFGSNPLVVPLGGTGTGRQAQELGEGCPPGERHAIWKGKGERAWRCPMCAQPNPSDATGSHRHYNSGARQGNGWPKVPTVAIGRCSCIWPHRRGQRHTMGAPQYG